jgi:hypothetical protein
MLVRRPMMFSHLQTGRSSARLRRIYHLKAERAQRSRRSRVGVNSTISTAGESSSSKVAYGLGGLEYGYEEECRVDRGHYKELPVWSRSWSPTDFASTLQRGETGKGLPETT